MNKNQLLLYLRSKGFKEEIIKAFEKIKREDFIPDKLKNLAYLDEALPLEKGATISQPFTIAFMLSLLELKDKQNILEIGSGSGYVLALINQISKNSKIFGVEIIKSLVNKSNKILNKYKHIKIIHADGSEGLKDKAPFDRIIISASTDKMPVNIIAQLKDKGILVAPIKNSIYRIKKENNKTIVKEFQGFVFVQLIRKR